MSDCLFCQIINRQKPAYIIYENDGFLAFLDIFPYGRGHILVIPKVHSRWVWDVPNLGEYMEVCRTLALHISRVMKTETTYSFIFGEQVPHAHIHLVPTLTELRERLGAGFKYVRQPKLDDTEAEKLAQKLKLE